MNEDETLYKEFLEGNQKAFEKLIDKYAERLIYFIESYVKNFDIAEDLAQDVLVYILINKNKYNFKYSLKTYLFTIGKCRAFNYLKKAKRVISLEKDIYSNDKENDIEEIIFKNERNRKLRDAINCLNSSQSRAIFLADIEELPYKDICQILDMSMSKVKSLIFRGRRNLKGILLKEGEFYNG